MLDVAYAMAPGGGQGGETNALFQFLPIILIFAVFYFLLIRPQQKKDKEHKTMLDNLKKGDAIITQGGLYGKIISITDQVVTVEIAEKVRVRVSRGSVSGLSAWGPSHRASSGCGWKSTSTRLAPETTPWAVTWNTSSRPSGAIARLLTECDGSMHTGSRVSRATMEFRGGTPQVKSYEPARDPRPQEPQDKESAQPHPGFPGARNGVTPGAHGSHRSPRSASGRTSRSTGDPRSHPARRRTAPGKS